MFNKGGYAEKYSIFCTPMSLPVDDDDMTMLSYSPYPSTVHEWTKAIRRPTSYRVGNTRFHLKPRVVFYAALFSASVFLLLFILFPRSQRNNLCDHNLLHKLPEYNPTYPLTNPMRTPNGIIYKIGLITDLDTNSANQEKKNTWLSYYRLGNLTLSESKASVNVKFGRPQILTSNFGAGGRGMELSELVIFNGKLYSFDDRTGIVYEILKDKVIPWVILADGDGSVSKGFKCEWATVKDQRLYVGGLGKEWTTTKGEVVNLNPQWVKSIGPNGDVQHIDWHENYNAMRKRMGMLLPGYIIHEAGVWSDVHKSWFFLPRRASKETYDETEDEHRATNLMFIVDEKFKDVKVKTIGQLNPTRGFSSFKFIPGTQDSVIVALKSEETQGKIASYILAFNIDGSLLMPETKIGDVKYEGVEFV